ncbi:hypothetical protein [Rhizobium sp. BT03]|uniref:hypothetical protein n=1 Tax=Rhizobium sp. BT03 TaxID=3045156 RepID=UPI0024B3D089|nr:hypothetical protein [Rhizobium sp. BT03]WHO75140.1 hypothetical protein QMO80_004234 [Rhizobium sp. BT03]
MAATGLVARSVATHSTESTISLKPTASACLPELVKLAGRPDARLAGIGISMPGVRAGIIYA